MEKNIIDVHFIFLRPLVTRLCLVLCTYMYQLIGPYVYHYMSVWQSVSWFFTPCATNNMLGNTGTSVLKTSVVKANFVRVAILKIKEIACSVFTMFMQANRLNYLNKKYKNM